MTTAVIVIGRNESQHLPQSFASISGRNTVILYVDSGSVDGSPDVARSAGVIVHELDPSQPFSPARARREGVEVLLREHPDIHFIQFVDGDCMLDSVWLDAAIEAIQSDERIGIVCGQLTESSPESSIYNRMNAVRWKSMPSGDIDNCGGIFLIRRSVYEACGGFRSELITGEEAEFCQRVRASGNRIVRLKQAMAQHDSDMLQFRQWWQRAVWGGFGDALKFELLEKATFAERKSVVQSLLVWVVLVPLLISVTFIAGIWQPWLLIVSALCMAAYALQLGKIAKHSVRQGNNWRDSFVYSALCLLRKVPYGIGFVKYRLRRDGDHTVPDAHAANTAVSSKTPF